MPGSQRRLPTTTSPSRCCEARMFLTPSSDLDPVDPDPALLAFIKCHITSLAKWEVLRVLAGQGGNWIAADQLVRSTHRSPPDVAQAIEDLVSDGVVDAVQVSPN